MIATATARNPKLTTNNNSRRNSICHLFAEPLLALLTSLPLRQTPTPRAAPTRRHDAPAKPPPAAAPPSVAPAAPASNASAKPDSTTPAPAPPHRRQRSLPPLPQIRIRFPWPCPPYELGCKRTKSRKVANRGKHQSQIASPTFNPTFSTPSRQEAPSSKAAKLRAARAQAWPRKHVVEIHTHRTHGPTVSSGAEAHCKPSTDCRS